MSHKFRRRNDRSRPRVEALEPRALLAVAGSLDPSFGGGYGSTTAPLGAPVIPNTLPPPFTDALADSVVALPDGQILVSGTVNVSRNYGAGDSELVVEKLNADGSLDPTFGHAGRVQLPIGYNISFTMAVQADGRIVLAAATPDGPMFENTYLAARLNANGSLDTTFGTNGVAQYPVSATTPTPDRLDQVDSILFQSDGRIILAGNATDGFSAVRLNTDGSLDTTYGQGGTATVPIQIAQGYADAAIGAAIQADGQVVVAGTISKNVGYSTTSTGDLVVAVTTSDVAVIRLTADGALDTTYGGSTAAGLVVIPSASLDSQGQSNNTARAVAIQPSTGDVLVAGSGATPVTLYRLKTDGTLDTSFGNGGLVEPQVIETTDLEALSMTVQPDGAILLDAAYVYGYPVGSNNSLELIRLNPDGSPDPTFGNTATPGTLLTRLTSPVNSNPASPAIQPATGDILVVGVGTIRSTAGLTYGLTVDSILPAATTTGPAALTPPSAPPADFAALGYSDLAVYDPTDGSFHYRTAFEPTYADDVFAFGIPGVGQTIPAVADYQGAGYSQIAAYLSASGVYAILPTPFSPGLFKPFGMAGVGNSIPVPADYEGTGQADVAVYMPSIATFAILPADGSPGREVTFGMAGAGQSIPAPADYYGTGQADIAVYLAQMGVFAIQDPTGRTAGEVIPFGKPGLGQSIPVPGDYDGSGRAELAVYVPSVGAYFYQPANGGTAVEVPIGAANSDAIPVPGDYDGSGRTEVAIYSPSGGSIEYKPANGGPVVTISIGKGGNGSLPVAAPAGALPEFAAPRSYPTVHADAIAPAMGTSTPAVSTATVTRSAAPAGPTLTTARVARSLVNQPAPDPLKTV